MLETAFLWQKKITIYGKESYWTDQVADCGRPGQSGSARRPRARSARRQHHGASARSSTPPPRTPGGLVIPVVITVYQDKSFTFITKSPPASVLLKKAAGIASGSKTPNKDKVGKVTRKQVWKS